MRFALVAILFNGVGGFAEELDAFENATDCASAMERVLEAGAIWRVRGVGL